MNHRSLAFRLGVWYTLLLSATFILVGAVTFFGLQQYLRSSLRDTLGRRSEQVERILLEAPTDATSSSIAREIETRVAPEFTNRFVRVTRMPATLAYLSGPPSDRSFDPSAVSPSARSKDDPVTAPLTEFDLTQHLMIRATPISTASGSYLVEFGTSIAPLDAALDRLLDMLALLLPVLIVCAAVGGYWLVNRALRPVDRLSRTAEQMSLQNLSQRLPVVHSGDALERLSISFNTMLGRLRDSLQTSRRFLADASHELRTPLTVIKGELEELTRESGLTEMELRERVGSVLEEVARLEHLVSGLLVLSRLDAGETQGVWVDLDLADLASNTAEHMRLMADDRGIEIDLSALGKAVIQGDQSRLKQIIVNLLDNAIALMFGQKSVRAVEINKNILKTVNGHFGDFTGHLDRNPKVTFVNDEARSYIARTDERFDVIEASFIDTWAATAAGAMTLTENSLYTVDAWKLFLTRLNDQGVLSFSRWYLPEMPGEAYRLTSLAAAALRANGVVDPRTHILMVKNSRQHPNGEIIGAATILVSKAPFTATDIQNLQDVAGRMKFPPHHGPSRRVAHRVPARRASGALAPPGTPARGAPTMEWPSQRLQ